MALSPKARMMNVASYGVFNRVFALQSEEFMRDLMTHHKANAKPKKAKPKRVKTKRVIKKLGRKT